MLLGDSAQKLVLGIIAVLVLLGAGIYWIVRPDVATAPVVENETQETVSDGSRCHESDEYFVVEKMRGDNVGTDILIKIKATSTQEIPCVYQKAEGDIELADLDAAYVIALSGNVLILDHGTAPPPRGLSIYDISEQKSVYEDQYNRPIEIGDGTITYWQPTDEVATTEDCPGLAQWSADGLGAGIEREVTLDIATLEISFKGETRCSARQ